VKVSGGGRCNVTHACFDIGEMSKKYPRGGNFVKKTFHHFFTTDTINWFKERGVALKTEEDGRMFPVTDSSQTIIDCLMKEAARYGVEVRMQTEVKKLQQEKENWIIETGKDTIYATAVCIAAGGYPRLSMFEWLKELGHSVEEPVPSLFTFNLPAGKAGMPGHPITDLMGVTVTDVKVKITGTKLEEQGPLLITHWGLSGPAILRLSAWGAKELKEKQYDFGITINWIPEYNEQSLSGQFQQVRVERASQKISHKNPWGLPQRLWSFFLEQSEVNKEERWAGLSSKKQNRLIKHLCTGEYHVKGKTTFKEEFVTAGGIKLDEIDHLTMRSKMKPNLFFAGEIVNVDGITGGFNFQHAWTSGYLAAQAIAGSTSV
jgi:predicted Rossmann fold flavoprotein